MFATAAQTMDDDVAQMMRDLGNERRDRLSAPDEPTLNRRQEETILAKAEAARRSRVENASTDAKAQRLRAWNDESTFEPDEVSAQLENRMSGQGHRERLNVSLGRGRRYDERRELQENRYGEERSMYLQEKAIQGSGNYSARTPSTPSGRYNSMAPPASLAATPRSIGRLGPRPRGPPAQPPRGPNRNRAPSPRAAGRFRDVGGQRVTNGPTTTTAAGSHSPKAVSTTPAQPARPAGTPRIVITPSPTDSPPPANVKTPSRSVRRVAEAETDTGVSSKTSAPAFGSHGAVPNIFQRAMAKMRANDATLTRARAANDQTPTTQAHATLHNGVTPVHNNETHPPPAAPIVPALKGQANALPIRFRLPPVAAPEPQNSNPTTAFSAEPETLVLKFANETDGPATNAANTATSTPALESADSRPTTATPNSGYLRVLVTGVAGNILSSVRHTLSSAIRATLSFSFEEGSIPPRELTNMTERLARDMERRAHGLDGVVRSADGLMEEHWEDSPRSRKHREEI